MNLINRKSEVAEEDDHDHGEDEGRDQDKKLLAQGGKELRPHTANRDAYVRWGSQGPFSDFQVFSDSTLASVICSPWKKKVYPTIMVSFYLRRVQALATFLITANY